MINGQDAVLLKEEMVSPMRKINPSGEGAGISPQVQVLDMVEGRTPLRKSQIMNQQWDKITEEES